jgi:hypothetical protein
MQQYLREQAMIRLKIRKTGAQGFQKLSTQAWEFR